MPKQHPAQTAAGLVRQWEDCIAPHDLPKWAEDAALTLRALLARHNQPPEGPAAAEPSRKHAPVREGTFVPAAGVVESKIATSDFRWIERKTGYEMAHPIGGPFSHSFPSATTTKTLQQRFQLLGGREVWHDVPTVGQHSYGGASGADTAGGHSHSSLLQLSRQERIQQHRDHVRRMFNDYSMRDDEIALPPELVASKQERIKDFESAIATTRAKLAGLEQQLRDELGDAHA
jgi:hypothetical protein